jgi:glucokinase
MGGTKIEISLVAATGHVVASHRIPTQLYKGPDGVIDTIVDCIRNCLGEASKSAQCLGIGVAGQIEKDTGVVLYSPNLYWHDVPIRKRLEDALSIPVMVTNDVRAATYGEWLYGAGQGVDDLVCLFIGTGIGGGAIIGGRLLEGHKNSAGELGHMTIVSNGRKCHCPNSGCLEAYVGGWAIAERAQELAGNDPEACQTLLALAGSINKISAATVTEAYNLGDPLAQRIVEETAQFLAAGIVAIVNALNPHLFILGGGVIQGLPAYVSMVDPLVHSNALEAASDDLHIVKAALGNKAGVIGAAALALHKLRYH